MSLAPFIRTNVTVVNGSLSNANVQLQGANPARQRIFIQNTSDTVMWLNFGAAAAANVGILIPINGGTWVNIPNHCPRNSINLFCAGAAKTYAYFIV